MRVLEDLLVGSGQHQVVGPGGGDQDSIGGIFVESAGKPVGFGGDAMGDLDRRTTQQSDGIVDSGSDISLAHSNPTRRGESRDFQRRNRREVPTGIGIVELLSGSGPELGWKLLRPDPNMGIEEQIQSSISQSSAELSSTRSPSMWSRPRSSPSRLPVWVRARGSIRAMGCPRRVTSRGLPESCTCRRSPMHFALNSEMATVFIEQAWHSRPTWSTNRARSGVSPDLWRSAPVPSEREVGKTPTALPKGPETGARFLFGTGARFLSGSSRSSFGGPSATMCVMAHLRAVGVRELRQNLSKYLRLVNRGETLQVTDRGRPVAALGPLPEASDPIGRLTAEGRLRPARLDLLDIGPPLDLAVDQPVSEALEELRQDD